MLKELLELLNVRLRYLRLPQANNSASVNGRLTVTYQEDHLLLAFLRRRIKDCKDRPKERLTLQLLLAAQEAGLAGARKATAPAGWAPPDITRGFITANEFWRHIQLGYQRENPPPAPQARPLPSSVNELDLSFEDIPEGSLGPPVDCDDIRRLEQQPSEDGEPEAR